MTLAYAELLDLVWVAPLAVVAVAVTFSVALLGATRSGELRRAGSGAAAAAYALAGVVAAIAFTAIVVIGIAIIVTG